MNKGQQTELQEEKPLVLKSSASYRGLFLIGTDEGVTFFIGKKRYDCLDLDEAIALIDAMYSSVAVIQ